jgi:transposase
MARIRELENALGKSTMKVKILKGAIRVGREKKFISRAPLSGLEDFK